MVGPGADWLYICKLFIFKEWFDQIAVLYFKLVFLEWWLFYIYDFKLKDKKTMLLIIKISPTKHWQGPCDALAETNNNI